MGIVEPPLRSKNSFIYGRKNHRRLPDGGFLRCTFMLWRSRIKKGGRGRCRALHAVHASRRESHYLINYFIKDISPCLFNPARVACSECYDILIAYGEVALSRLFI